MQRPRWRALLSWVGLACILCAYVVTVIRLHPTNFFGLSEDDTFYFSSAKAIAQGEGYVMPSLPGAPIATKYPPLYPWLLSYVWRWNRSFPGNLVDAVGLTVCFGLAFLTLTFVFLRKSGGMRDWEALAITGFCALQPIVLLYSGSVLTEIPFAALMLASLVVADRATWPHSPLPWALLCGVLAGLSAEMRMFGVAVIAGIAIAALLRRAHKQFCVFCVSAALFLVPVVWRRLFVHASAPATVVRGPGWTGVWMYDTSYVGVWRVGIPDFHIFLKMLVNNFDVLLRTPSHYLLADSPLTSGELGIAAWAVVTTMIIAAFVRQVRRHGWSPIYCVLVLYAGMAVLWAYNSLYRFFLPFLPIFVAAYWSELKHVARMVRRALVARNVLSDVVAAIALAAVLLAGNAVLGWFYLNDGGRNRLEALSNSRAAMLVSERQAYDWLARSAPRTGKVVAYQDGQLYLYTGRQSMRSIILPTAEFLDPTRLPSYLEHMTDVARAISADYWLVSDDDFSIEWSGGREAVERRMRRIEQVLPVVFSSSDGRVRIYGLGCLQDPAAASCAEADAVLFPQDTSGAATPN